MTVGSTGTASHDQMLDELFRKILANPLQPNRSLEYPVLERDRVWEKAEIENWRALTHLSPDPAHHDRSPYDIVMQQQDARMSSEIPHAFAIDVMRWSRSLEATQEMSLQEVLRSQSETLNPLALVEVADQGHSLVSPTDKPDYMIIALKISSFIQLAQQAIFRETIEKGQDSIHRTTQEIRRTLEETRQANNIQQEVFARNLEEHRQRVEERIQEMDQAHQIQVNILAREIDAGLGRQQEQQMNLDAARAQNEAHAREIHQLRIAYQARQRELEQIRQEAARRRGGCILL